MTRRLAFFFIFAAFSLVLPLCAHAERGNAVSRSNSPAASAASPLTPVTRSDDDLVLVDVTVNGVILMQSVPGYASKSGLILPLGQLTDALEFPIKVSAKEGIADGWAYDPGRRFALDAVRHEVTLSGVRMDYEPALVEIHGDDIYADSRLIGQWLELKIDFSFSTQTVAISTTGENKLPIQISADLEKSKKKLANGYKPEEKKYPVVRVPYALASTPYADVSSTTGYDGAQKGSEFSHSTSVEATGDLLYMTSDFFATVDNREGVSNLRWSLSRRDPDGDIFSEDEPIRHSLIGETAHDLKIRDVTFGDIFMPALPLTANNQNGRGAFISNHPFDSVSQFDRTALEGDILPNWDVELYRNDELLAFQRAGGDGRYVFTDVPLIAGLNIFRLVFHGPFGETREDIRRIQLSDELTRAGQSHFSAGVVQEETDIISMRRETSGIVGIDGQKTRGQVRSFFEYEYGLMDNLALFTQLVELPTDAGNTQGYMTGGLGTSVMGVYGRVDVSRSSEGGTALQGSATTSLWGVSLFAQHQIFDHFISDATTRNDGGAISNPGSVSIADPIVQHTEMRVDTPLDLPVLPRLNLGFTGGLSEFKSGMEARAATQRISATLGAVAISNNLSWQNSEGGTNIGSIDSTTTGDLTVSAPMLWETLLRGSARYDVQPRVDLQSVALTGDKALTDTLSLRGEVSRDLTSANLTTYSAGLNKKFDQFQVGLNSSYDSEDHAAVFFNVSFSAGPDPRKPGGWKFFPDQTARDGIVSARTYLDRNNNGTFDDKDEIVQKADLRSDGGGWSTTGENGTALLRGQRTTARNNVTIDADSLSNPSWIPKNEGYSIVTRPGVPARVDFAVAESGSIDGTAYIAGADGVKTVASNVAVQLLDKKGKMVRETRSSFDGYYAFERVEIGDYRLRVSPNQLNRKHLDSSASIQVAIKGEDSNINNADFILTEIPAPPMLAEEDDTLRAAPPAPSAKPHARSPEKTPVKLNGKNEKVADLNE